jgi:hypothetical protein
MTTKRIFGYIFLGLSVILMVSIVGQILNLIAAIFGFFKIFTGTLNGYETGRAMGALFYWVIYFFATFLLWSYGRKWTRKNAAA